MRVGGNYWFVAPTGDDANNDGKFPVTAFLTWQHAIDTASAGDGITVLAGAYDEPVAMNKTSLEIFCELGTTLTNSAAGADAATSSFDVRAIYTG